MIKIEIEGKTYNEDSLLLAAELLKKIHKTKQNRLKELLNERRMTLHYLSRAINMSYPYLSEIANNKRALTSISETLICYELGIEPKELYL